MARPEALENAHHGELTTITCVPGGMEKSTADIVRPSLPIRSSFAADDALVWSSYATTAKSLSDGWEALKERTESNIRAAK